MGGLGSVLPFGEIGLLFAPPLVMLGLMALGLFVFAVLTRRRRSPLRRSPETRTHPRH
jgi:hypothetical protein